MNAAFWIGYCEHRTADGLEIFNYNIGKGGFTIFASMIATTQERNLQGLPWCVTFVHAIINRPDILGKAHPGTHVLQRRMKRKGFWRERDYLPRRNDLIFLANDTQHLDHVGIVDQVFDQYVISIDGNTHDDKGRFTWADGGVVGRNSRLLIDPRIVGYAAIGELLDEKEAC